MKINLVMIVKNEEQHLKRCLEAVKSLVDEMIIADTGSSDRTAEIAREMGAIVLDFPWAGDFSAARNFALDHSDADWNLVLDADECLRPCRRELLENILNIKTNVCFGGITVYNSYQDEEGISQSTAVLPRLLPRGVRYVGIIHEQPDGMYDCYPVPLAVDHDGYLDTGKGERNLSYLLRAAELSPYDEYYQFQLASTLRNLKRLEESLAHFRRFYNLAGKYEPYRAGGVVLYLYTLLDLETEECLDEAAEIIEREEELMEDWPDFCFVCGIFYMKRVLSDAERYISLLPRIERCYLKCLSLGEHPEMGGVVGTGSFKAAYNLGVWYEVSGQMELAKEYYMLAAKKQYRPAEERLEALKLNKNP